MNEICANLTQPTPAHPVYLPILAPGLDRKHIAAPYVGGHRPKPPALRTAAASTRRDSGERQRSWT